MSAKKITTVLGVRIGHDAGACVVVDGRVIVDIAEERLTRKKNDGSFPMLSIEKCLSMAGLTSEQLDAVAIPSTNPVPDIFRFFPGLRATVETDAAPPSGPRLQFLRDLISRGATESADPAPPQDDGLALYLPRFPVREGCRLICVPHHKAHAASAYYTAGLPLDHKTLIVVMDGIGDRVSASIWRGEQNQITSLHTIDAQGSLGWFYSAVTEALDWRHGSDEWKVMGLAPYGTPQPGLFDGYHPIYRDGQLVGPHDFGDPYRYPDHGTNHYHLRDAHALAKILEGVSREDFSAEAQRVVEEQADALILPWLEKEGARTLCCAGGFFLNVKYNGRLWRTDKLDRHWIFPNPGDNGLPLGAALSAYFEANPEVQSEKLNHLYLGPDFSTDEIKLALDSRHISYSQPEDLPGTVARLLANNHIIGWFQGRMESGPRALGARSILMSPLRAENKDIINASVKYREAFRPFCPSMIDEARNEFLIAPRSEPFMITAFDVTPQNSASIPAVVHVDGSLRPQTVESAINPRYHALIKAFGEITGTPVILNTSFNVKGEPIVCTPSDAIRCFFDTGLEYLAIGDFLVQKPGLS